MSIDILAQAISLIKSGDTQGGQKLLAEVVRSDPGNETAWLWLSSVAPADKRRYCLDRVLKINPENALAKQLIEQLQPDGTQPPVAVAVSAPVSVQVESVVVDAPVAPIANTPVSNPTSVESPATPATEYWTVAVNKEVRIILFQGTKLIAFNVMTDKVPRVLAQMDKVEMTKEWYRQNISLGLQIATYKSAPINRVLRVRLLLHDIKIEYREENGEDASTEIRCKEDAISDAVMASLQKRLGEKYVSMSKPTSRRNLVLSAAIILLIPICLTAFSYGFVLQPPTGRVRTFWWIILFLWIIEFLGPNGVLFVGSVFILLALAISIYMFVKPPLETILIHKSLLAKQQASQNK